MIDYNEALKIAAQYLQDSETPLQITYQEDFSEGWLFCFQSVEYVETGNPSTQLAGNGPFIIDKDTGELHVLGTEHSPSEYLEEYKKIKRESGNFKDSLK